MRDVASYVVQLVENELCVSICWQFPAAHNFFPPFLAKHDGQSNFCLV